MGLSNLGIFHTIIGIAAIIAGVVSFVRFGKINLQNLTGKIYFYGTLVTSVTALGIYKHGGFNAGHVLSLLIIVLVIAAFFLHTKKTKSNKARYFENFFLSFSFFLSMVPTINETLTRVPVGKPFASSPKDPIVINSLLVTFILFIIGSVYQIIKQRKINKNL
ncbi:hypothetical protein A9P82_00380 [Arachidicoccus ginsenosidimutans]|uniref:hypothetical protein n=1 Tax=Arachidicoccus sp. BS20 TaxID=1850526 RepID=UPI0007F10998|nr:hypothetical protein [Arachidicoccus sp. BS20]ANI87910.1 hypothetical protein A9P82_00380 [Arachidicoccus sp. BS20]